MLNKENIKYITGLSPLQEGIFFHHLMNKSSQEYFMQTVFYVNGDIDLEAFNNSFRYITERHDILRAVFIKKDAMSTRQIILKTVEYGLNYLDLTDGTDEELEAVLREDRNAVFDLAKGKLMRVTLAQLADERYAIIWSHHHIIMDGWCIPILLGEFMRVYRSYINKVIPPFHVAPSYSKYIEWLQRVDKQASLAYWNQYLEGYAGGTMVPGGQPSKRQPVLAETELRFDNNTVKILNRRCATAGITINTLVETLWAILLSRYNDIDDVLFGSVVSGRPPEVEDVESIIGLFINTVPVRVLIDEDQTVMALAKSVQHRAIQSLPHHYVQLADIMQHGTSGRIIDHLLAFENYPTPVRPQLQNRLPHDFDIERTQSFSQTNYDLNVLVFHTDDLLFRFVYNANRFLPGALDILKDHLRILLDSVLNQPTSLIRDIELITGLEKIKFLDESGGPGSTSVTDSSETIVSRFEQIVRQNKDRIALVCEGRRFTFEQLNKEVNQLANHLIKNKNIQRNDIVAVMTQRSHRTVIAMMAILKAGAAYLLIDTDYSDEQIAGIVNDASPKILLCDSAFLFRVSSIFYGDLFIMDLQEGKPKIDTDDPPFRGLTTDAAYVTYTPGSMGVPKGVIVEHLGIINLCNWAIGNYEISSDSKSTCYSAFGFDSLVIEIFPYLLSGAQVHMLSGDTKAHLEKLCLYLTGEEITHVFLPTSVLRIVPPELKDFVSRNNVVVITAGGHLRSNELSVYYNYGSRESSVVAACELSDRCSRGVTIGGPITNNRIYILDRKQRLLPAGCTGEICIGGRGIARGYLNDPELTAQHFIADPLVPKARVFRSGDYARWNESGRIEFEGREEVRALVRGRRVNLREIEEALLHCDDVTDAAAIIRVDHSGVNFIIAYYSGTADPMDIRSSLRSILPEYLLPGFIIKIESIPFSDDGKLDKANLPDPPAQHEDNRPLPATKEAAIIGRIWEDVLSAIGLNVSSNFFELGGHSIKAVQVISRIKKELQVSIELRDVFTYVNLGEFIDFVSNASAQRFHSIQRIPDSEYYPLSNAQRRLYILSQLGDSTLAYNISGAVRMTGRLSVPLLKRSLEYIVRRHEALRTVFRINLDGDVVQKILDRLTPDYIKVVSAGDDAAEFIKGISENELTTPFDLANGPLFRVTLIHLSDDDHVFIFTMHHIISDGWSMSVLKNELISVYNALAENMDPFPPLTIQYRDAVAWQEKNLSDSNLKHEEYWLEQFAGQLPVLDVLPDRARPAVQTYRGKGITRTLPHASVSGLRQLCRDNNATLFMGLVAVTNALLSRYTGSADIIVGTPIAGREHKQLENQIGVYINTLAIRTIFEKDATFIGLLKLQRDVMLKAYEHQAYPFDKLIDKLDIRRDPSRSPLFDVMVEIQNDIQLVGGTPQKMRGIQLSDYALFTSTTSQFDLTFSFFENVDELDLSIVYNTDIYDDATIERIQRHFQSMLTQVASTPAQRISFVDLLDQDEKRLLASFNETSRPYDLNIDVVSRFRKHCFQTPDAIAIIHNDRKISFSELDLWSERLAAILKENNVRGKPVALHLSRSIEFIAALISIWKAGAVYVPVDPDYGSRRISSIYDELQVPVVMSTSKMERIPSNALRIDVDVALQQPLKSTNATLSSDPADIAYILYTSGSTGTPKGAMLTHGGMLNHLLAMIDHLDWQPDDRMAQTAKQGFDISVWQMSIGLVAGTTTVIYDNEAVIDVENFTCSIASDRITMLEIVPTLLVNILSFEADENLSRLRYLIVTGEAFPSVLARRWFKRYPEVPMVNAYGPTEASDDVTLHIIREAPVELTVPVGRPVHNMRVYILDDNDQLCPIGVKGRICVGGVGVGTGYVNRNDQAGEAFMQDFISGESGSRLYDTGDIGRFTRAGVLECFGRCDNQVKVLGQRVELEEIENAVKTCTNVLDAAVIAAGNSSDKTLVAFYTALKPCSENDMRIQLLQTLQLGLVPTRFIWLSEFPVTSNGKVDRLALARCDLTVAPKTEKMPSNKIEQCLFDIWTMILGTAKLTTTDDFFKSGGNSLKAIQLGFEITKKLKVDIDIPSIFMNSTIESQGLLVRNRYRTPANRRLITLFGEGLDASKTDVVFLPPAIGLSYSYIPMIRQLEKKINPFLAHIRGIFEDEKPFETMEELVTDYEQRLIDYLQGDTVILVGFSAGAYVGFELGKLLSGVGFRVTTVIIDSPVQIFPDPKVELQKAIANKDSMIEAHMKRVEQMIVDNNVTPEMLDRYRVAFFEYAKIIASYSTNSKIVNMDCVVFYLENQPDPPSKFEQWKEFIGGDFQVIPLKSGTHADLMSQPDNLEMIINFINEELLQTKEQAE